MWRAVHTSRTREPEEALKVTQNGRDLAGRSSLSSSHSSLQDGLEIILLKLPSNRRKPALV